MPALPDVPNVLRVEYLYELGASKRGGDREYYLYSGSAPDSATCDTIATAIQSAYSANLLSLLSNGLDLLEITVTDLSSTSGGQGSWTGELNGTRDGAPVTVDAAVNLQFIIARRYRGGKPKAYLPFGIQSDLSSDVVTWNAAFTDAVNTQWGAFDTAVLAISESGTTLTQHVSVSYYEGFTSVLNPITGRTRDVPKLRSGGPLVDTITGHVAKPEISQQRRRRTSTSA